MYIKYKDLLNSYNLNGDFDSNQLEILELLEKKKIKAFVKTKKEYFYKNSHEHSNCLANIEELIISQKDLVLDYSNIDRVICRPDDNDPEVVDFWTKRHYAEIPKSTKLFKFLITEKYCEISISGVECILSRIDFKKHGDVRLGITIADKIFEFPPTQKYLISNLYFEEKESLTIGSIVDIKEDEQKSKFFRFEGQKLWLKDERRIKTINALIELTVKNIDVSYSAFDIKKVSGEKTNMEKIFGGADNSFFSPKDGVCLAFIEIIGDGSETKYRLHKEIRKEINQKLDHLLKT